MLSLDDCIAMSGLTEEEAPTGSCHSADKPPFASAAAVFHFLYAWAKDHRTRRGGCAALKRVRTPSTCLALSRLPVSFACSSTSAM